MTHDYWVYSGNTAPDEIWALHVLINGEDEYPLMLVIYAEWVDNGRQEAAYKDIAYESILGCLKNCFGCKLSASDISQLVDLWSSIKSNLNLP